MLPVITDKAVEFIKRSKDEPFFLYFPLNAPHTPILPTKEWQGRSKINAYADFTMQVDSTVGRVLDTLDELDLADNTLIVFTTDNGCSPAAKIPELEAAGHDQNYIFRGHKADIFEGGHRVPFIARWPGEVTAGSTTDHLVGQIDFFATFAEMLGQEIPGGQGEDSFSFLATLRGSSDAKPRSSIVSQSIGGQFAIRDGNWKLCLCPGSGGWSAPRPGRPETKELPSVQLYNLEQDPGESKNLYEDFPDRVEAMTAQLKEVIDAGRSTPGPSLENDVQVKMIKGRN